MSCVIDVYIIQAYIFCLYIYIIWLPHKEKMVQVSALCFMALLYFWWQLIYLPRLDIISMIFLMIYGAVRLMTVCEYFDEAILSLSSSKWRRVCVCHLVVARRNAPGLRPLAISTWAVPEMTGSDPTHGTCNRISAAWFEGVDQKMGVPESIWDKEKKYNWASCLEWNQTAQNIEYQLHDHNCNLELVIFKFISRVSWAFPVKLPSGEYQKISLVICQHWFS